ncbi:hypothetical protein MKZ38_007483 [Zalerion maritima]|uniref:Uncharacterized protein n=1 Tax=Zalerion maritima TaxID=339359 RepID=A0AAD5RWH4_9PEZI|nr:hypothetical protein MKZ38_007483 [Zalerion maritima]
MALPQSAIFSPTAARLAASTAKDWNTIDSWLHRHFHGRSIPKFERNPETLKALLALSSLNESADEERDLLCAVEKDALRAIKEHEKARRKHQKQHDDGNGEVPDSTQIREGLVETLEASLPKDGQTALTSLSQLALSLDPPPIDPSPEVLATRLMALQAEIHLLEQQFLRISTLSSYLTSETERAEDLLKELRPTAPHHHEHHEGEAEDSTTGNNNPYMPPSGMAKQNLETQRLVKQLSDNLSLAPPSRTSTSSADDQTYASPSHPTIPQLKDLEDCYKDVLSKKRALEIQVGLFEGLPPNVDDAKQELDRRRRELAKIEVKRDVVFEGLVERESPMKKKR